jgi:hypothetical protein
MRASERAAQIWSVLALAAHNRQVLTYDIVSKLIGVPRHGLGQLLEPIQSYCLLKHIPPLSILVVNQTGIPGVGFIAAQDIPREQLRVFDHHWLDESPPTPEELQKAVTEMPSNGTPAQAGNGKSREASDGRAMAQALAALADRGTFADIGDASEWQREVRQDRSLPSRENDAN